MLPMQASFLLLVIRFMSYELYGTISQQGSAWSIRNTKCFKSIEHNVGEDDVKCY
eukprot:UN01950